MISPLISLRDGDAVADTVAGALRLTTPAGPVLIERPGAGLSAAFRRLADGGATEDELCDLVLSTDGAEGLALLLYYLDRLGKLLMLRYALVVDGASFMTLTPISPRFVLGALSTAPGDRFVLSRFAFWHRHEDELVVESPLSHARVALSAPAGVAVLAALVRPCSSRELTAAIPGVTEEVIMAVVALFAGAGMLSPVRADGGSEEEEDLVLWQWNFHDLLFHSRSRLGRHNYPAGATYRFLGRVPPPPAIKDTVPGDRIALARADITALMQVDRPLTRVLEERRSIRAYADRPISAWQLGEFLYRVARVKEIIPIDPESGLLYESSRRPYPGGGAMYELELYLAIDRCDGIPSGLFYYDPVEHQLCRLAERTADVEGLLRDASRSAGVSVTPQVLIVIAARLQRMGWKYDGMAYAVTLKNAGVLLQTMYLVATAMDLAPCALGGGDADRFARAAGTDYLVESSVGEFMLGSRPDR